MTRVAGNRTAKNRRPSKDASSRDHLLDVRVRRSGGDSRHRSLQFILGLVLWISLALSYFGFQAMIGKFFLHNPEYNLSVVGRPVGRPHDPRRGHPAHRATLEENIFRVDLTQAEHALEQIDQVESVTIERDWPNKVTIRLTKRVPVAWLARAGAGDLAADHTLLLDAQGMP